MFVTISVDMKEEIRGTFQSFVLEMRVLRVILSKPMFTLINIDHLLIGSTEAQGSVKILIDWPFLMAYRN